MGFLGGISGKESACWCRRHKRCPCDLWVKKIPQRRKGQTAPVFLPGKFMDRGAGWATIHRVTKSQTQLNRLSMQARRSDRDLIRSDQISRSVVSNSLRPHESQHARPPCPSPTPGVHSDSRPSSQWCHPAILSSVVPFSSCHQSLPASESFPMSQLFSWGGQSTGVSASASFLPKKSQGWYPSEWTGWISLQSKGLSRVFSSTTVQKHQLVFNFFLLFPNHMGYSRSFVFLCEF